MSDGPRSSAVERLMSKSPAPLPELIVDNAEPGEQVEERRAYSVIRGRRGQLLTLDIRLANGNRLALGYPYLAAVEFDASGILTMEFSGRRVIIKGISLGPVYEALLNHAVGYLQELDAERDQVMEGEPFIQSIEINGVE